MNDQIRESSGADREKQSPPEPTNAASVASQRMPARLSRISIWGIHIVTTLVEDQ